MNFGTSTQKLFGFLVTGYFIALLAIPAVFLGYLGIGSTLTYFAGSTGSLSGVPWYTPTASIALMAVIVAGIGVTTYASKRK